MSILYPTIRVIISSFRTYTRGILDAKLAKRARIAEPEKSDEPSPPTKEESILSKEHPALTTTVTNNNLRAERRREEERKARALEKKQSLGLQQPHKSASRAEHAAYDSISPNDETIIAWIIGQRIGDSTFYDSALSRSRSPYVTATAMLRNARYLGNQAARRYAASFLERWRSSKTPFLTGAVQLSPPKSTRINNPFSHTWNIVNLHEKQITVAHIQYRWAMAFLARAYADKISMLEQEDKKAGIDQRRGRDGRGNLQTEAKNALLPLVFPNTTKKQRGIFYKRLEQAQRWYEFADSIG
ncbi:hypothetical protein K469DRAFT_685406 [Zopfia rhizophila CBS 207.26]|uniref:Uncharacterized protein n=1 Tax=Zopfia rhizophila CBS 207.26 TaxID=1314779 RepID=A0A6A6D997_9PEZI|nr:hypothetical protein K469DRAFT_685406 [Zopfia rhizophila CBS 207.26]